jgi:hypothetical protein
MKNLMLSFIISSPGLVAQSMASCCQGSKIKSCTPIQHVICARAEPVELSEQAKQQRARHEEKKREKQIAKLQVKSLKKVKPWLAVVTALPNVPMPGTQLDL